MTTTHISPICVYPRHPSCYPDFALVLFAPELRTYPHFSRTSKTQQEILVINNTSSIDKLKNQRKSVLFYEKLQKNQALVLYEKHEMSTLRVDTETLVNRRVLQKCKYSRRKYPNTILPSHRQHRTELCSTYCRLHQQLTHYCKHPREPHWRAHCRGKNSMQKSFVSQRQVFYCAIPHINIFWFWKELQELKAPI